MSFSRLKKQPAPVPKGLAVSFEHCAAKTCDDNYPGLNVQAHGEIVASVVQQLMLLMPDILCSAAGSLPIQIGALHDLGKVSPGFQLKYFQSTVVENYAPELAKHMASSYETDHAAVGAAALNRLLGGRVELCQLARIVARHHGAIKKSFIDDHGGLFGGRCWSEERSKLFDVFCEHYGHPCMDNLSANMELFISGLLCVADWIGSDEANFPAQGVPESEYMQRSLDAVKACGFVLPSVHPSMSFFDVFQNVAFDLQDRFAECVRQPGLYILEAPMGQGKTEAALYAAYKLLEQKKAEGIYFGLPTRLTSDRIHERVVQFLDTVSAERTGVRLAHGTAWLNEGSGGESLRAGMAWSSPRKRRLLFPFAVGTVDQALMAVLRVKHHFVRTYALAGKVVILDEVHSYDSYTLFLIQELIRQLLPLNTTIIVLSATLTNAQRAYLLQAAEVLSGNAETCPENLENGLDAYPLITGFADGGRIKMAADPPPSQAYELSIISNDNQSAARLAVHKAEQGNCVLCIANTVAQAQAWYDAVQSQRSGDAFDVGLLHSRFPQNRRDELEAVWLDWLGKGCNRPNGCVLVATQVVEQSVDIDADVLITELAPIDALLQRMGRVWRHKQNVRIEEKPEVYVVCDDLAASLDRDDFVERVGKANALVYPPYLLWTTYEMLSNRTEIMLPDSIRNLLEEGHRSPDANTSDFVKELFKAMRATMQHLCDRAKTVLWSVSSLPTHDDKETFATRYSDFPTVQLLLIKRVQSLGGSATLTLLNNEEVNVDEYVVDYPLTRKLYGYTVSIATYLLGKEFMHVPVNYLKKHFFESPIVLEWNDESGSLEYNHCETGLYYTPARGIGKSIECDSRDIAKEKLKHGLVREIEVFDKSRFDW